MHKQNCSVNSFGLALLAFGFLFTPLMFAADVPPPPATPQPAPVPKADKARAITGIYAGTIKIDVNPPLTLPLQIALTVTGETVITQIGPQSFDERNVIDGAFVVDDEGGPYGFSLVTYNLDKSQIDMRYNRLDATLGAVASSFRLVGNVIADGSITGRVLSGLRGPIGTFEVKRQPESILRPSRKYSGIWRGEGKTFPAGAPVQIEIGLGDATRVHNNPPTYEFTFTPGKLAYISWNNQPSHFNQVAIDYLRRQVAFSDTDVLVNGQAAAAECYIDQVTGELVGTLYGVYRAKVATFRLPRTSQPAVTQMPKINLK